MWTYNVNNNNVGKGLFLSTSNSLNLVGYGNSIWVVCLTNCRPTTEYWKTKKQKAISQSFVEAQYIIPS